MRISLIVAMAENGVIGRDGGMPWRLSTDMRRFKAITMGKPVIMGRKTWESLHVHPLPGRFNVVVTRNAAYAAEGATVAGSLDEALQVVRRQAGAKEDVFIIGGGEIYRQALPKADMLHVTHVRAWLPGDTVFPEIDQRTWQVELSEDVPAGEKDAYATRYVVYRRRREIDKPLPSA